MDQLQNSFSSLGSLRSEYTYGHVVPQRETSDEKNDKKAPPDTVHSLVGVEVDFDLKVGGLLSFGLFDKESRPPWDRRT